MAIFILLIRLISPSSKDQVLNNNNFGPKKIIETVQLLFRPLNMGRNFVFGCVIFCFSFFCFPWRISYPKLLSKRIEWIIILKPFRWWLEGNCKFSEKFSQFREKLAQHFERTRSSHVCYMEINCFFYNFRLTILEGFFQRLFDNKRFFKKKSNYCKKVF